MDVAKHIAEKENNLSILKEGLNGKPPKQGDPSRQVGRNNQGGRRRNRQMRRGGPRGFRGGFGRPRFNQRGPFRPWFRQNRRFGRPFGFRGQRRPPTSARQRDLQDIIASRQNVKLEGEKAKRFDEISAEILNHDAKQIPRPPTAFQAFVDEKRKENPKLAIKDIQAEWDKHPEKEKRREKSWNAFQDFLIGIRDHNKKRLELVNQMHTLIGKPVVLPRENFARGFDLYWKDVEAKVKSEMPHATPYELLKKRQELWRTLKPEQKRYYILLSNAEREKILHTRRMATIENRIVAAKEGLKEAK